MTLIASRAGFARPSMPVAGERAARALGVLETCARDRAAAGLEACAASLRDADSTALLAVAASHGMHGLLFRRLRSCAPGVVSPVLLEQLQSLHRAAGRRGLRQEARLLDVLGLLAEHGIRAVPFKGPVLSEIVYGDVAMRVCSDLDVLVPAVQVVAARDLLFAAGWLRVGATRAADHAPLEAAECELVLRHPESGLYLELHWRTGPRFARASFPAEPLIERAGEVTLLRRRVPCLDDEDHLLVLCVHGATHCWDRLELVCTVGELIGQRRVRDWAALLERARRLGCRRRLLIAATLAGDVAGVELPRALAAAVRADEGARRLAAQATARRVPIIRPQTPGARLAGLVWQARALDGTSDRVRHLVGRAVTPGGRDRDWVALPRRLSAGYYLVRPLRLVAQYAGTRVRRG